METIKVQKGTPPPLLQTIVIDIIIEDLSYPPSMRYMFDSKRSVIND